MFMWNFGDQPDLVLTSRPSEQNKKLMAQIWPSFKKSDMSRQYIFQLLVGKVHPLTR